MLVLEIALLLVVVTAFGIGLWKSRAYRAWEIADMEDGELPPPVLVSRAREPALRPRARLGGPVAELSPRRERAQGCVKRMHRARDSLDPDPSAA